MLKRVAILLICLLMVFIATFSFIVGVVSVPTIYSYAESSNSDLYTPLRSQSDLVTSFQVYCKSRDLTIDGSVADAVTTFTTGAFNGACNTLGLNISELQAEIKAEYDQTGKPVKFLFNSTGVMAMNRIFAQFLQDNNLQVGDSVPTDNPRYVYDGKMDYDSKALIWIVNSSYETDVAFPAPRFIYRGSFFYYNGDDLKRLSDQNDHQRIDLSLPIDANNTFKCRVNYYSYLTGRVEVSNYNNYLNNRVVWGKPSEGSTTYGSESGLVLLYDQANTNYYYGSYRRWISDNVVREGYSTNGSINKYNYQPINVNVYITTNNNTINNNTYEGDTIINNEGDVIVEPDPVPPGGNDPGWNIGGGDGTADDGNGNTWNIKFPDFELPDLNIDWQINGLGDKFPFSIPFDLVALVTVLNAEPEAPRFEGTVDFGFTTWDYDINLEQFDTVASACRIAEILLLVFGLILITRSIIKG